MDLKRALIGWIGCSLFFFPLLSFAKDPTMASGYADQISALPELLPSSATGAYIVRTYRSPLTAELIVREDGGVLSLRARIRTRHPSPGSFHGTTTSSRTASTSMTVREQGLPPIRSIRNSAARG